MPGVPAEYDAGINGGLGVPAGFYHFALEAGSPTALAEKRDELRAKGVETTEIVDHGWARSIYFKDPNGLSLEYCCVVRDPPENGEPMQGRFTIPRDAPEPQQRAQRQYARTTAGQHTQVLASSPSVPNIEESMATSGC